MSSMMSFSESSLLLARSVVNSAYKSGVRICGAESCTGGLISAVLTAVPGSSDVLEFDVVTYSNESKNRFLHVSDKILSEKGAVSAECAAAMVDGVSELCNYNKKISFAVTGIAGPGGGTANKPVGLVYIGLRDFKSSGTQVIEKRFSGDRNDVRNQAVETVLNLILGSLG